MKFESIRGNFQRFLDLMHIHGGPKGMIKNGIPWEKVVWGRMFDNDNLYFEIRQQKDEKGVLHFFIKDEDSNWKEWSRKDLAYNCDLYDKDGKLLSILFFAF